MEAQVLEQIVSLLAGEIQGEAADLDRLEGKVAGLVRRVGREALQRVMDAGRKGYEGSQRPCGCGHWQRFVSNRSKQVVTMLGPIRIRRAYYRCEQCGQGELPYDRASGLGSGQLSNRLAGAVSLLAVHVGFAQAAEVAEQLLGVRVDDNTVQQTSERAGAEQMRREDASLEEFHKTREFPREESQPERLYVALDGTTGLTREGWREVKCAVVYWDQGGGGRELRYAARLTPSEAFGEQVWYLGCRYGLRGAQELVVLGDGAEWIWKQVGIYVPRATQILDWYHASEHLWACANELYGEGTPAAKKWAKRMEGVLWESGGTVLLDRLRGSQRSRSKGSESLAGLIGYVQRHVQRMAYPTYRARGLDVGSGPVESACKRLVGGRLKQGGMRWSEAGANAILALRTVWFNGQWRGFWDSKPLAA